MKTSAMHTQETSIQFLLFQGLWASALCGIGLSYRSVYLFHILLIINILYHFLNYIKQPFPLVERLKTLGFLEIFWLAAPLWFLIEMAYCESKIAALQHLILLFFGVSLVFLSILNIKTSHDFKRIFGITVAVAGINIGIGCIETTGFWRYPISSLSRLNDVFGYKIEFWNALQTAFNGALINPSPSLNYAATMQGAYNRLATIPSGMFWNPNDYALFLLFLLPLCLLHQHKIFRILSTAVLFFLIVMAGARLVFIAASLAVFVVFCYELNVFKNIFLKNGITAVKRWCVAPFFAPFFAPMLVLFIATNGFGFLGKFFWQANEMAFFLKTKTSVSAIKTDPSARQKIATSSVDVRKTLISEGISTLKTNYGIGIGGGNMSVLLARKGGIGASHVTKLHNFWLECAVEGGIIFAFGFAIWFFIILKKLFTFLIKLLSERQNKEKTSEKWLFNAVFANFIVLLVFPLGGIASSSLIYYLPMYALFGWTVALIRFLS